MSFPLPPFYYSRDFQKKESNVKNVGFLGILLALALAYVVVSLTYFRFSHPEMTETQLFLNLVNALTWRS